jgi:hypothetical protein
MKNLLRLEEAAMVVLGIYLFDKLHISWGWFFGLLLAPDIAMLGYLVSTRAGAFLYNLFHHKAVAIILYLTGVYVDNEILQLAGIMMFVHSSMDRVFGYGLKYNDSFKHTHIGMIGE